MFKNRLATFSLFLSGILILSACVTGNTNQPAEAPGQPGENETPYPDPGEEIVHPTDSTEPYPEPAVVIDPYPSVDDPDQIADPDREIIVEGFLPISSDKDFNRGPAFIDSSEIILKESFPVQVELVLIGSLPTPCHQLRVVASEPDADGHIEVEVYSVSNPDVMCIQVLEPVEVIIPLGDYTEGNFTLSINGEPAGEFNLP